LRGKSDELEEVLCLERWSGAAGKITFEAVSSVSGDVADLLIRRRSEWRENNRLVDFDVQVRGFDWSWLGTRTCAVSARG